MRVLEIWARKMKIECLNKLVLHTRTDRHLHFLSFLQLTKPTNGHRSNWRFFWFLVSLPTVQFIFLSKIQIKKEGLWRKTKTFLLGNKMSRLGLLTTMQDANFSAMQLPEDAGRLVGGIDQGSAEAGRLRGCSPGGPWSLASKFIWGHRRPGPVPGQLYQLSCSRVYSFLKTLDTQPHH